MKSTMMETPALHTPGPWRLDEHAITGHGRERVTIEDPSGLNLADCGFASSRVAMANATLMSAAPELLVALRGLLGHLESWKTIEVQDGWMQIARAAIAKAEGRT